MKVSDWIKNHPEPATRNKVIDLEQRYGFLSERLFLEYEPTRKESQRQKHYFMLRLEKWLDQFGSDQEKLVAFKSIEYLFFAGIEEFYELFRCARVEIERWLMDVNGIDPFESKRPLSTALEQSWLCPITDSFRINSFLHVNGLSGKKYRPDWLSLKKFACDQKISNFVRCQKIKHLVLLEDFVGSGRQASAVLDYAASILDIKILVVPLIICGPGLDRLAKLASNHESVRFRPVVVLPANCLVAPRRNYGEPNLFRELRKVMRQHYKGLGQNLPGKQYGFQKVASLVVTHSNCPNNTPPMYRQAREGETALFPRLSRPWAST